MFFASVLVYKNTINESIQSYGNQRGSVSPPLAHKPMRAHSRNMRREASISTLLKVSLCLSGTQAKANIPSFTVILTCAVAGFTVIAPRQDIQLYCIYVFPCASPYLSKAQCASAAKAPSVRAPPASQIPGQIMYFPVINGSSQRKIKSLDRLYQQITQFPMFSIDAPRCNPFFLSDNLFSGYPPLPNGS